MSRFEDERYVSAETEALFAFLIASGADPVSLTALVSSAYADGGNHVLDEFEERTRI